MAMQKGSQFWLRVVIAVLAASLFFMVHAIYWPVIISLILTFIMMPIRDAVLHIFQRLTKRQLPIDLAILISFAVLICIISLLTNIILKPLVAQVNLFAANFNDIVAKMAALVAELENEQTQFYIPNHFKSIINEAFIKFSNYGVDGISNLISSVFYIAGTVVEFFVVPFITFYFMKDGGHMVQAFVRLYPASYQGQLMQVFHEVQHVLSRYIRGQILMSCIIATLTFIGMWALGVPYPMVIGVLAAITEWVPIVGPIVGAIPAILLGATIDLGLAVKVLVFYVIIQQIDSHLIMPQVMGAVISIHPVVIVSALLVGGTLFGVAGMILTVPVTAVLQIICKHLWFYNTYREKAMNVHGKE